MRNISRQPHRKNAITLNKKEIPSSQFYFFYNRHQTSWYERHLIPQIKRRTTKSFWIKYLIRVQRNISNFSPTQYNIEIRHIHFFRSPRTISIQKPPQSPKDKRIKLFRGYWLAGKSSFQRYSAFYCSCVPTV